MSLNNWINWKDRFTASSGACRVIDPSTVKLSPPPSDPPSGAEKQANRNKKSASASALARWEREAQETFNLICRKTGEAHRWKRGGICNKTSRARKKCRDCGTTRLIREGDEL